MILIETSVNITNKLNWCLSQCKLHWVASKVYMILSLHFDKYQKNEINSLIVSIIEAICKAQLPFSLFFIK